jgi:hypothetical protein
VPHDQPLTFSFISTTHFSFPRCKNHQAHLYVNFSSTFPSSHSQTIPKPHKTTSIAVLQFILILIVGSSEKNTTAFGTTELQIHKGYKLLLKGTIVMRAV